MWSKVTRSIRGSEWASSAFDLYLCTHAVTQEWKIDRLRRNAFSSCLLPKRAACFLRPLAADDLCHFGAAAIFVGVVGFPVHNKQKEVD